MSSITKMLFQNFWLKLGTIAAVVAAIFAYQQLQQPVAAKIDNHSTVTIEGDMIVVFLNERKIQIEKEPDGNTKRAELNDIEHKLDNIEGTTSKIRAILNSSLKLIQKVKIDGNIDISDEAMSEIVKGNIKKTDNILIEITKSNTEYSPKAANNSALLSMETVNYKSALDMFKTSIQLEPNYRENIDKAIEIAEKTKRYKARAFFVGKKYKFGELDIEKDGIKGKYIGVLSFLTKEKDHCGIEKYKNGSEYIGQYHNNMRHGYGISYFPGKGYYLDRYVNGKRQSHRGPTKITTLKNTEEKGKYIGKLVKHRSSGWGMYKYNDGTISIGSFKKGYRAGYGCYFEISKKKITWYRHGRNGTGLGKALESYVIQ